MKIRIAQEMERRTVVLTLWMMVNEMRMSMSKMSPYHWNRNNQRIEATIKTTPLWFIRLSGFHINQTNPYSMVTLLENGLGIALQSLLVLITIIGKLGKWCHASSCQWIRSCGGTSFSCFVVAVSWCCTSPPLDFFQVFYTSTCRR